MTRTYHITKDRHVTVHAAWVSINGSKWMQGG